MNAIYLTMLPVYCVQLDSLLEVKAYYAGHVLGAAMVLVTVGSQSFVYTVSLGKFMLVLVILLLQCICMYINVIFAIGRLQYDP